MPIVTPTETAAYEVENMLKSSYMENGYLKIKVNGGGRTDLVYGISAGEAPGSDDEVLEYYGLKILVDKDDAPVLNGTKIDFKQSLMSGGFQINNPNIITSCGCGGSFGATKVARHPENC